MGSENDMNTYIKVKFGVKFLVAFLTFEFLYSFMDNHMFVKVCLLGKRYVTPRNITRVWALFCVGPQVIEEVVPTAEYLTASDELAAKKTN
jgi:hypothetical protein